jgi:hypothetical protein
MTYFTATVDAFHVADAKVSSGATAVSGPAPDPNTAHKVGERCRARGGGLYQSNAVDP